MRKLYKGLSIVFLFFVFYSFAYAETGNPYQFLQILSNPEKAIKQANSHSQKKQEQPALINETPIVKPKKKKPKQLTPLDLKEQKVKQTMEKITPTQHSALEKRVQQEQKVESGLFGITFYKPTYILPAYYTSSPYGVVYRGDTPDNQKVKPLEFKVQFSIKVPFLPKLTPEMMNKLGSLYLGYTQLSYWQFYAKSQYFRETDYEPELFMSKRIIHNWFVNYGIVHQSNGRGGSMERSWNRIYVDLMFSGANWMISIKPWLLIFKSGSSNLHNPNIEKYLGHGRLLMVYKIKKNVFSLMLRNNITSEFKRGAAEFDYSFPIYGYLNGYVQAFAGYGQSLIEYNHSTKAIGIGFTFNNWI